MKKKKKCVNSAPHSNFSFFYMLPPMSTPPYSSSFIYFSIHSCLKAAGDTHFSNLNLIFKQRKKENDTKLLIVIVVVLSSLLQLFCLLIFFFIIITYVCILKFNN